ncbi:methylated-DNA--[protein]-cysteine S-methyltransferase [Methylocapsa palsarum]|uniref:methylated-DNA--[protein]-cysteine S-methyltransferase n=1 Tax=Methylocapsa palsarum TaxID=1612308 RepID=A0A1I3YQ90_9HYPH|nr:methylated-DNA--[protein]-cysteine S-methyltransferase [Methylocapsa palsarum]SFK33930.1 AraC family transcriptional regulator, regulatory protein of adaptative response / methylated-DNA-[protein]-cysteine methyltransferase [Methylocapsa palsarum]
MTHSRDTSLNERPSGGAARFAANSASGLFHPEAEPPGAAPAHRRAVGAGPDMRFTLARCSLGPLLVAASRKGVCAIMFGEESDELARELLRRFSQAEFTRDNAELQGTVAGVIGCIEEPSADFALPLDIRGTAFQQLVWAALRDIPPGTTASYAEIATRIGNAKAARAVAGACAANHIAVAIPCHRVVRTGGALSGYRWGVERKRALLDREARARPGV